MFKQVFASYLKYFVFCFLIFSAVAVSIQPGMAQSGQLQPFRSDVGVNGVTANFHSMSDFKYLGTDTLRNDGTSELEIILRDVRTLSPRLGVGFQILTSFFSGNSFGIGSYGLGPVLRAYPFKTERVKPYFQANALFGRNLALSKLANTERESGFRFRLGLRGGIAFRITNSIGLFTEFGYDWESSILFKADARAFQTNIGVDLYLFN